MSLSHTAAVFVSASTVAPSPAASLSSLPSPSAASSAVFTQDMSTLSLSADTSAAHAKHPPAPVRGRGRGGYQRGRGAAYRGGANNNNGAMQQSSQQQHMDHSHSHPHQQHEHARGGRERGRGRGGRGRGRGGYTDPATAATAGTTAQTDDPISAADARAIEAALLEDEQQLHHSSIGSVDISASSSPPTHPSSSSSSSSARRTQAQLQQLLGFRYDNSHASSRFERDRDRSQRQRKQHRQQEVFNKHVYVAASHAFLLSASASANLSLPDDAATNLDWQAVELVIVPTEEAQRECPICLSPPVAAKITRCGHVFCATCILHYLSVARHERAWAKCPLCFDSVYAQALKSAEFRVHRKLLQGEEVEFVLMKRFREAVNAVPVDASYLFAELGLTSPSQSVAEKTAVVEQRFARLTLVTDISDTLHREMRELSQLRRSSVEAKDDFTLSYLREAEETFIVRRIAEFQNRHPSWTLSSPTYEEWKQQEAEEDARREEENKRRRERQQSGLYSEGNWPQLSRADSQQKSSTAATATATAATAATQRCTAAASPPPKPVSQLQPLGSKDAVVPPPSSSSSSSTVAPSAARSSPPSSSPSRSPPQPSRSPHNDAFFDDDDHEAKARFMRQIAHEESVAAAAAAAAGASSDGDAAQPATMKPTTTRSVSSLAAEGTYLFYQCIDGQQVYLHSLNYRSLALQAEHAPSSSSSASAAAGTYNGLPLRIKGKLLHLDQHTMDATTRSKYRWLSHLPVQASFRLALVDLDAQLSPQVRSAMAAEMAGDKQQRLAAARKQQKLNARTIAASRAEQQRRGDNHQLPFNDFGAPLVPEFKDAVSDAASFPTLPQTATVPSAGSPLLGSAGGVSSGGASMTSSPETRGRVGSSPSMRPANWNVVAEKGMASSELWAPLSSSATAASAGNSSSSSSSGRGGTSSQSMPTLNLGSASWGRKSASPATTVVASSAKKAEDVRPLEPLPEPTINRLGQTTLLSTASKRSYR